MNMHIDWKKGIIFTAAFALILTAGGFLHSAQAAEHLLVTCEVATQPGLTGVASTNQNFCTVPGGNTVSRATLDTYMDDGGDVYLDSTRIYHADPTVGIKSESNSVAANIFNPGQTQALSVYAQNATDGSGNTVGEVFGRAVLYIYGDSTAPQTHLACVNNACVSVSGTGSNQCSSNTECAAPQTHYECRNYSCVSVSGAGSNSCSTDTQCRGTISPSNLTGSCTNVNGAPRINLSWNKVANQTANSILKMVNNGGFAWLMQDTSPFSVYSYTDTNVSIGNTYTYRQKNDPLVGSNDLTIVANNQNCGITTNPQPTADIKANGSDGPVDVAYNSSAAISWTSQGATFCSVSPGGWTGISGNQSSGNLTYTQTYTVNCTGPGGSASDSVQVRVGNAPQITADIKANDSDGPVTISYNGTANITWTSQNATYCSVYPGGWTGTSGSQSSGNLTYTQTYTVNCTGANGSSAQDSVTVNVGNVNITADIKANNQDSSVTIPYNTAATISWTSQGANYCYVSPSGWTGTSGSKSSGNLTYQQTYSLYCTGANGSSAQDSVTVNIGNPPSITADIKANGSDGPVDVAYNSSAAISWTSQNATFCSVSPGGWTGISGNQNTPSLTYSATYYLNCTGAAGSAQDSVQINVGQVQAPTVTINANPSYINQGQSSTLTWSSQNATYCVASSGWSGNQSLSGSQVVNPGSTTNYVITCYNGSGQSAVAQTTVTVGSTYNSPTVTLTSNPSVINQGQSSVLNWNSQNANSCYASGGSWSGSKSLAGGETVYPYQTTTYYINCTGQNGQTASAQTTVYVNNNYQLPTVTLTASPSSINSGQSSTLYWNSQNANYCYASNGWNGNQNISGSTVVYPTFTTNYNITCTNNYGQATAQATVYVNNYGGGTARNLQVTKSVLNRTLNQTTYSNSVEGQGLDVLEFEIRVRNIDSSAGSVNVQDVLPQELFYAPQSTSVNGINVADGITTGGLSLGNLNPNEEKIIRFRAVIFAGTAQKFITNQVNATMNSGVQNAYATVQVRNRGQVLGAADISTGPDNPVPWVLGLGFLVSAGFYLAAFRFRIIKLAGPVLTPYEKMIYALREEEKTPDTSRPKPGKNLVR